MSLAIPSDEFLGTIERLYSIEYPPQFRAFCARHRGTDSLTPKNADLHGRFITDLDTFRATNIEVGEGELGDYENAILGKRLEKNPDVLWGELLIFYREDHCIFGFAFDETIREFVDVWSVHTIVHRYRNFAAFVEAELVIV